MARKRTQSQPTDWKGEPAGTAATPPACSDQLVVPPQDEVSERFRRGMGIRRLVHGHEHVDAAWQRASGDEQRMALEEFVTECVWGTVWARNGLTSKTRSLLTIGLLIAMSRPGDLRLHIRSAVLNNGCSMAEVREVMIHTAAYCGVAGAVEAFALSDEVAAELNLPGPRPYTPHRRKASGAA